MPLPEQMRGAWRLPWHPPERVPHALLDILRGCNVRCAACYNHAAARIKPLHEIERDLDVLLSRRRLHSVSIVGGEPTLHPELPAIVAAVRRRGLRAELFTNGLDLSEPLLAGLQSAGLDLIFLHVEQGQQRPDLAAEAGLPAVHALAAAKAALVASRGIEVGMSMTPAAPDLSDVLRTADFFLSSEHIHYLLVTFPRDRPDALQLTGDISAGISPLPGPRDAKGPSPRQPTPGDVLLRVLPPLGLRPFAYVGSNLDPDDPRWISCMIATRLAGSARPRRCHSLKPALGERFFLLASRLLTGRYPMFLPQNRPRLVAQLLLNALSGGDLAGNLRFLLASSPAPRDLRTKRLLFQFAGEVSDSGAVIHCRNCPDAVARNGSLVPVCLSDYFVTPSETPVREGAGK